MKVLEPLLVIAMVLTLAFFSLMLASIMNTLRCISREIGKINLSNRSSPEVSETIRHCENWYISMLVAFLVSVVLYMFRRLIM